MILNSLGKNIRKKNNTLSDAHSKAIIRNDCAYCTMFRTCKEYIREGADGRIFRLCLLRSSEDQNTWIRIDSKKRRRKIRTGDRFGKLTVLNQIGYDRHGHPVWRCVCDCGNICAKRGHHLLHGDIFGCGCQRGKSKTVRTSRILYEEEEEEQLTSQNPLLKISEDRPATISEYSSPVGRIAETVVEIPDPQNDKKTKKAWAHKKCDECGHFVVINKDYFEECINCGLIHNDFEKKTETRNEIYRSRLARNSK